jgi:hypothetical protein
MNELIIIGIFLATIFCFFWCVFAASEYSSTGINPFDRSGDKVAKAFRRGDSSITYIDAKTHPESLMFVYDGQHLYFSKISGHLYLNDRRYPMGNKETKYKLSGANRRMFRKYQQEALPRLKMKLAGNRNYNG